MFRRRAHLLVWFLPLVLAGCGAPPPYQTFSPDRVGPLAIGPNNLVVYNLYNTTPETDASPSNTPLAFASPPTTAPDGTPMSDSGNKTAIAICYSRIWNSTQSVKTAAAQACGGGTARLIRQGTNLDACTLLTPTQAVYACTATP